MMKTRGMIPRKQRTAYLKENRPKLGRPKPMSDDWRKRMSQGDPKAKEEIQKHYLEAAQSRNVQPDAPAPENKKPDTVVIRGTKMQARNAAKTHELVAGYRMGGASVSKKAMQTQGPKAITDALKGEMNPKKIRESASAYDVNNGGSESGFGPKRAQAETLIYGVKSGRAGESLWTAHKRSASKS